MIRHPGGTAQTKKLLTLSGIRPPARILDLGAGDGDTVALLRSRTFDATGLDLRSDGSTETGDFLNAPYPDQSFDAVISECAMFVSGDRQKAVTEAFRLLRDGGRFLYADVWFEPEADIRSLLERSGFHITAMEDVTPEWQRYYLNCIWEGTFEKPACEIPKGKCRYYLIVAEKISEYK